MFTTETQTTKLGLRRRNKSLIWSYSVAAHAFRSLQTIMQNYYIRIEDMPSLVSHQLSIIKYVVLKKIFFLSVLTVSFGLGLGLGLEPLWTRTWLGLEPLWTRSWLGLEPLWTWTCLGLDKGGLVYSPTTYPARFGGNLAGIIAIGSCSSAADPLVRFSTPAQTNSRAVSLRD